MPHTLAHSLLSQVAEAGALDVVAALKQLGQSQSIECQARAEVFPLADAIHRVNVPLGQPFVASAYLDPQSNGGAILILSREDALRLVDVLHGLPLGTSGIIKDIDRDALKETLNIISNAYLNTLYRMTGISLAQHVPQLSTMEMLQEFLGRISAAESDENGVVIESDCVLAHQHIRCLLYVLYRSHMAS